VLRAARDLPQSDPARGGLKPRGRRSWAGAPGPKRGGGPCCVQHGIFLSQTLPGAGSSLEGDGLGRELLAQGAEVARAACSTGSSSARPCSGRAQASRATVLGGSSWPKARRWPVLHAARDLPQLDPARGGLKRWNCRRSNSVRTCWPGGAHGSRARPTWNVPGGHDLPRIHARPGVRIDVRRDGLGIVVEFHAVSCRPGVPAPKSRSGKVWCTASPSSGVTTRRARPPNSVT